MTTAPTEPLLVGVPEVTRLLKISPRHLWRMIGKGDFPQPLHLGDRVRRWPIEGIRRWVAERELAQRQGAVNA